MRPMGLEYLSEAGPRLVEQGFRQMKTQMGAEPTAALEVARIRTLREGIGPDIDLMCDINQLWNVNQAIQIGSMVEEYNLFWLEDVVARDDYQGLARVADALVTPICAGEYVYGIRPFRHMVEQRSVDIVMVDLLRAGGITPFRKIAGMAEAFNLPVVSHLIPEVQTHTIAAIPNGLTVEYMPWSLRLFDETPDIVDGEIVVPDRPGLGLSSARTPSRNMRLRESVRIRICRISGLPGIDWSWRDGANPENPLIPKILILTIILKPFGGEVLWLPTNCVSTPSTGA